MDLSLEHADAIFASWFLKTLGFATLVSYLILGRAYWFNIPLRCILLALGNLEVQAISQAQSNSGLDVLDGGNGTNVLEQNGPNYPRITPTTWRLRKRR